MLHHIHAFELYRRHKFNPLPVTDILEFSLYSYISSWLPIAERDGSRSNAFDFYTGGIRFVSRPENGFS
jgi:hypothetical protein